MKPHKAINPDNPDLEVGPSQLSGMIAKKVEKLADFGLRNCFL